MRKRIPLLLLGLLTCGAVAEPFRFSDLKPDDEVRISYFSSGCFNWDNLRIQIKNDGKSTLYSAQEIRTKINAETRLVEITEIIDLGSISLSAGDIKALDKQFQAYREGKKYSSMDRTEINAEYLRSGMEIGKETFINIGIKDAAEYTLQEIYKKLLIKKIMHERGRAMKPNR